jgi:hypothetical protein
LRPPPAGWPCAGSSRERAALAGAASHAFYLLQQIMWRPPGPSRWQVSRLARISPRGYFTGRVRSNSHSPILTAYLLATYTFLLAPRPASAAPAAPASDSGCWRACAWRLLCRRPAMGQGRGARARHRGRRAARCALPRPAALASQVPPWSPLPGLHSHRRESRARHAATAAPAAARLAPPVPPRGRARRRRAPSLHQAGWGGCLARPDVRAPNESHDPYLVCQPPSQVGSPARSNGSGSGSAAGASRSPSGSSAAAPGPSLRQAGWGGCLARPA